MENYTRIIGATSTNIRTPDVSEINQGNNQLTPFESAKNNGYNFEMSSQIGAISAELTNYLVDRGLTPNAGDLTQFLQAIDADLAILGSQATTSSNGLSILPKQVTISNGTDTDHDIDFTAGNFNFDDGTGQASVIALTKQIDANWVAGTNAGGLDTGVVAIDTTYHCFAIYNPTTNVSDFLFSLSPTSPTLPSGFTKQRRIASLTTDGSANIRNGSWVFNNDGSYTFTYDDIITDVSQITSTADTLHTMTAPPNVEVKINCHTLDSISVTRFGLISSPISNSPAPTQSLSNVIHVDTGSFLDRLAFNGCILTDSSSQIRSKWSATGDITFVILNFGWIDNNL